MKTSIRKICVLVVIVVIFQSLHLCADPIKVRIDQLITKWEQQLDRLDCMVFVTDLDGTFHDGVNDFSSESCQDTTGGMSYREYLYKRLAEVVIANPKCIFVYNTARPYFPVSLGELEGQRADACLSRSNCYSCFDSDDRELMKQQMIRLGIDLKEHPAKSIAGLNYDQFIVFREAKFGASKLAILPKPDVLITGSGACIHIGPKLEKKVSAQLYNQIVGRWLDIDAQEMSEVHSCWKNKHHLIVDPVTVGTYSYLKSFKVESGSLVACHPPTPTEFLPSVPVSSLLTCNGTMKAGGKVAIQNILINKGYSTHWFLQQLYNEKIIKTSNKNAVVLCGDSIGDIPMLAFDLRGKAISKYSAWSQERKGNFSGRLQELGIKEGLPYWAGQAVKRIVIPQVNSITGESGSLPECFDGVTDKVKVVTDGHGVLSLLEAALDF